MALELIGGALLSAFIQAAVDKLTSGQVLGYFRRRKLDEELLKRLKLKLVCINALVDDAEQKQVTVVRDAAKAAVKAWLVDVNEAVLDAEDLLDEIDYQVSKCELEADSESQSQTCTCKVWTCFKAYSVSSFDKKIESRMKQILEKLEYLANQKDDLGLKETRDYCLGSGSKAAKKLASTSLVGGSVIYGRDYDKEIILNWMISDSGSGNHPSILSVVGMGGMGKTMLAQHVYNDSKVEEAKFDVKAWVCVSDEFDVFKLSKAILEAITKSTDDSRDLEMVHGRLKENLEGKRLLVILDDVWNEKRDLWEALQTPLNYGAKESKILVTTRSEKVALAMQSNEVHHLKQLQEDHCWKVLAKHAAIDENSQLDPEFKEIGIKLVEKCKGLPLALKTIGSLLHTKSSVSEWESILTSEIWNLPEEHNNIIPALLLSYHHLPSALKRCFAFCALFPKDYEFDKEDLILLWMAENFLQCSQQSKSMEEVGAQYFDDMLSRSFFQKSQRSRDNTTTCYVMHDLLNDLANYVSGYSCIGLEVKEATTICEKTRHFSFVSRGIEHFRGFKGLHEPRLRTFLPLRKNACYVSLWKCTMSMDVLFSKFRFLRVLSFSEERSLTEVPDSICNLKHLRSLDLSHTKITKLPDSTCSLYNLQILKLHSCESLEELPLNLHKLTKLRHLDLRQTELRKMPKHLGELENLQVLMSSFCLDYGSNFNIQDLEKLNLRGGLIISGMQNIVNPSDVSKANFKSKTHLVTLGLKWSANDDVSEKENDVLEELQPSKYLKKLLIRNYGGTKFPSWFGDNSLWNLVSLKLSNCKNSALLPSFGLLPFLEILVLEDMGKLEKWECKNVTGAFPRLRKLSIKNCPKLKEQLPEQLPCLMRLYITSCEQLVATLPRAPVIQELTVLSSGKVQMDYNLFTLKKLSIDGSFMQGSLLERIGPTISDASLEYLVLYDCPNVNFPIHHCHNSLVNLSIERSCDSLTTFPLDLFPKLYNLSLELHNLQMISQEHAHNHLQRLNISDCPQLKSLPDGGLSSSFKYLSLYNCPQIMASLRGALEANNTSLETLSIGGVDVESFPDEGLLPLSVTSLEIHDCPNLKKLNSKGLCHLSSLKSLIIDDCPSLQCLPEEGLPQSISNFEIRGNCPMLIQRCQQPNGEDWGKIAHTIFEFRETNKMNRTFKITHAPIPICQKSQ
ncbi:putative disease resistance RPP13-like protein 1 [Abrus precatorius]|uniref:Disease resistance RPP13-like protein 1 n=1 Tax=Abrus precatorius TaxID=3816 RepID=A0A8B8LKC3_ABRPR|nr:putative disease resistance RPP13-like protein 1 [Abrus precatorius]